MYGFSIGYNPVSSGHNPVTFGYIFDYIPEDLPTLSEFLDKNPSDIELSPIVSYNYRNLGL